MCVQNRDPNDQNDPKRTRFQDERTREILETAESRVVQFNRDVILDFDEVIRRGMAIYEGEDVARMNYQLHALAMECRYKDQSNLEKLLLENKLSTQQVI